jgi:hypothetical protein
MKKAFLLTLFVVLTIPFAAMAMQHGDHGNMDQGGKNGSAMDHGSMNTDKMGGMSMSGDMIMLQKETVDGITGAAHLLDVKEKMAEHGMSMTHHIMIAFKDEHGNSLSGGKVAVKVQSPDGKVSEPVMMMGMDEAFGADITLDQKGVYRFQIGTKLEDGKKRTFQMHYDNS